MNETIALGETASGPGATGPGGRPVSLPVRELTRTVGLIAGEDAWPTAAAIVDALSDGGRPVLVVDVAGDGIDRPTPFDGHSCHGGPDADCRLEAGSAEEIAGRVYRTDAPIVVDGRRTDDAALAALARAVLQRSATDDRSAVAVVYGPSKAPDERDGDGDLARAVRELVSRGPDRSLGVCAVTARPAALETAVREAGSWSVWHRLTRTADTSVVRRELDGERAQAVRDLPPGEAFLATEWTAAVERVSVGRDGPDQSPAESGSQPVPGTDAESGRATGVVDRLERLTARVEDRLDPDRLAADIADALDHRLAADGNDPERSNGSRSGDGSAGDDGFAGFGLLDGDGADDEEAATGADSSAADGLAVLAGNDGVETASIEADGEADRTVSDGGLDVDGVAAEVRAFEAGAGAVGTDAARSGGKPAVVVDLESTLDALDDPAMAMLEYYRAEGPARPEAAHSAATERASRVPAYTLNRQLRRAGLIEHVGRGRYDYSLCERIEAGLPADRDAEMAAVYVRDLEGAYLD